LLIHTINSKSQRKDKSEYRIRLEEKQKLRFHYGITERQLLRYVRLARKSKRINWSSFASIIRNAIR
jgi:ribosomal protein S4